LHVVIWYVLLHVACIVQLVDRSLS